MGIEKSVIKCGIASAHDQTSNVGNGGCGLFLFGLKFSEIFKCYANLNRILMYPWALFPSFLRKIGTLHPIWRTSFLGMTRKLKMGEAFSPAPHVTDEVRRLDQVDPLVNGRSRREQTSPNSQFGAPPSSEVLTPANGPKDCKAGGDRVPSRDHNLTEKARCSHVRNRRETQNGRR